MPTESDGWREALDQRLDERGIRFDQQFDALKELNNQKTAELRNLIDERTREVKTLCEQEIKAVALTVDERRIRFDQRYEMQQAALQQQIATTIEADKARVKELSLRCDQRIEAMQQQHTAMIASMDRAITKAEASTEARFSSVNEFRAQLGDQTRTLIPRIEADQRFNQLADSIRRLEAWQLTQAGAQAEHKGQQQQQQGTVSNATAMAAIIVTIVIAMIGAVWTIVASRVPATEAIRPLVANQPNQLTHEQMLQLLEGKIDERLGRLREERTKP